MLLWPWLIATPLSMSTAWSCPFSLVLLSALCGGHVSLQCMAVLSTAKWNIFLCCDWCVLSFCHSWCRKLDRWSCNCCWTNWSGEVCVCMCVHSVCLCAHACGSVCMHVWDVREVVEDYWCSCRAQISATTSIYTRFATTWAYHSPSHTDQQPVVFYVSLQPLHQLFAKST